MINVSSEHSFIIERLSQNLKRKFFFKNRPIYFHINSSRVTTSETRSVIEVPNSEANSSCCTNEMLANTYSRK